MSSRIPFPSLNAGGAVAVERPKSAVFSRPAPSLSASPTPHPYSSSQSNLAHDGCLGPRTLSASNLNALSDRFCLSCPRGLRLHPGMAFVFSIQLCSRSFVRFCEDGSEPFVHKVIPKSVLDAPGDQPKPFLYALYGSSPFKALFEEIREEDEAPPSNYSSRPPSPPLSVDEDFRRRSRPRSLTLPGPSDGRERRNSAPHLPAVTTTTAASCVNESRNSLQQQHQQLQQRQQLPPFLSKTAQIEMHQKHGGSLGDLSPQTLIKTKAIRKIHKGVDQRRMVGPSVWPGDKIGASLDFRCQTGNSSIASSLASLDLPLRNDEDVDDDDDDDDHEDDNDEGPFTFRLDAYDAASPPPLTPPTEFSLTHLTASMVDAVVDDLEKTGDPAFALNSVRTVFGSFDAMASSFLKIDDSGSHRVEDPKGLQAESMMIERPTGLKDEKGPVDRDNRDGEELDDADGSAGQNRFDSDLTSERYPLPHPLEELDILGAITAFRRLWHLQPATVEEDMRRATSDAVEILLTELSKDEDGGVFSLEEDGVEVDAEKRRARERILFLVALHPIFEGTFRAGLTSVVQRLSHLFAYYAEATPSSGTSSSSSSPSKYSFRDLLVTSMPRSQLEILVERLKELLAVGRLPAKTEVGVDRSVAKACASLSFLHSVCRLRSDVNEKIFYCAHVCQQLDLTREYDAWRNQTQEENAPFSFLAFPFLLDPSTKVRVLHLDACAHMRIRYQEAIVHQAIVNQVEKYKKMLNRSLPVPRQVKASMCPFLVLEVRRDHLLEDAFRQLELKSEDLQKPLRISYVGSGEQGLDMGGLQKEFFQVVTAALFHPENEKDAFIPLLSPSNLHWFSSDLYFSSLFSSSSSSSAAFAFVDDPFEIWRFVGILLGLAVYNGIIIPAQFPLALYKKMMGQPCVLSDLAEMEPAIHRSLTEILDYEGDDFDQVFCLNFQTQVQDFQGRSHVVDLIPQGGETSVTSTSRQFFVSSYVSYLFDVRHRRQFSAFLSGFRLVAADIALDLFRPEELQLLVAGSKLLDFKALESSCQYEDGYSSSHPTIRFLWSVLHHDLDEKNKKNFLHFVTGSDRVPLQGLGKMPLMIQWHGDDGDRLPSAMTCFNRLLLPQYDSKDKLKAKLLIALKNSRGFGLS